MLFQISCGLTIAHWIIVQKKESIPACVTVEQASRSVQTRTWVSEIGDADSSRPSPTFHQRSKFPLSRGWTTMKRFDRSAHCSARTRGQPLEPFELVNCSSQRTGTVNSPSEIPLMDRIWIYRSTRARSAAVTGFLATGPDPKYPSPKGNLREFTEFTFCFSMAS